MTTRGICATALLAASRTRRGAGSGPGHDGNDHRYGQRRERRRAWGQRHRPRGEQGHVLHDTTDGAGNFTAPFLVPGTYAVEVNVQGFKKAINEGIVLQVNQRARVDVTLEVGRLEETTTVVRSRRCCARIRRRSDVIEETRDSRAAAERPEFCALVYLTPGITPGQEGENLSGASTFNPRGASNFNALGIRPMPTAGCLTASTTTVLVQYGDHFAVARDRCASSRSCPACFLRSSARCRRRLGFDQVGHATCCTARRSSTCATMPSTPQLLRPKTTLPMARSSWIRSRRSIAISSASPPAVPIVRNRTFFFADYSGLRESRGQVFVNTVPTARTRIGDFSDFPRRQRQPDPDLRSADDRLESGVRRVAAGERNQPAVFARPVSGNMIPAAPHQRCRRQCREHLPVAERLTATSTTTPQRSTARTTDNAYSVRVDHRFSEQATRSSAASTTASSRSTRRRARPPAACRRRPRPRRDSISGPSSPASRTRD